MRTSEEIYERVLQRGKAARAREKKTRQIAIGSACGAAACLALALVLVFSLGRRPSGETAEASVPIPNPNGGIERTEDPGVYPEHTVLHPGDEGYIEPAPDPVESENGAFVNFPPNQPVEEATEPLNLSNPPFGETPETWNPIPMIGAEPLDLEIDSEACYVPPENGTSNFSMPLREALEQNGDGVLYRVKVDLFRDEQPIAPDSAEAEEELGRIAQLGYTVAVETLYPGDEQQEPIRYNTLHATREQLQRIAVDSQYGYMVFLYDGKSVY